MKNAALILNAVLLVAVGVLFYLHFSSKDKTATTAKRNSDPKVLVQNDKDFKIGYFEWDSIVTQFELFKELKDELSRKEEANHKEKMRLRQKYQNKINSYSQRELSQTESEVASQEIRSLEMSIQNQIQTMDQELQELQMRKTNEIRTKIEDFLKEYNKEHGYSYIMAYEPQLVFYRDTAYNITLDLIKGLNEKYPARK